MTEPRTAEDQAGIDEQIRGAEAHFAEYFGGMEHDRFVEQGTAIFSAATEGFPTVNPQVDAVVKTLLDAILQAEAPKPFMGGRTAAAWRMYTAELIRRVSENKHVDFREIPVGPSVIVPPYKCDGWSQEKARKEIPNDLSIAEDLKQNFAIGGEPYIQEVGREIYRVWYDDLVISKRDINPIQHAQTASEIAEGYKAAFQEMVENDDVLVLRRGLSDHDFSHVVTLVSGCSNAVNLRWQDRGAQRG